MNNSEKLEKLNNINSYKEITDFLKQNIINKKYIIESQVYKYLTTNYDLKLNINIWNANITSMSLTTTPYKIRIRNDNFLKQLKQNNENIWLISGIKILNKKIIILHYGKAFKGYDKKIDVGNSFIHYDWRDLVMQIKKLDVNIFTKYKNELEGDEAKYFYCIFNDDDFKPIILDNFIKIIQDTNFDPYNKLVNKKLTDKSIPIETKKLLRKKYNSECAIYFFKKTCYGYIDFDKQKQELGAENTSIEFNHIIPRNHFKKSISNFNEFWDIIHDYRNLIPMCQKCHDLCSNKNMKNKIFYEILEAMKKAEMYDSFIEYMNEFKNEVKLDIAKLEKEYFS